MTAGMAPAWFEPLRQRLLDPDQRLPAGVLLLGRAGLGKFGLAMDLAAAALCQRQGPRPCGDCSGCDGFGRGVSPDLHLLTTEAFADRLDGGAAMHAARYLEPQDDRRGRKPRQVITVDQVRSLIAALGTRSHGGGQRVALLAPAGSLNVNAANALLKILEEPPEGVRFVLVAGSRDRLPATVLSRVAVIDCHPPESGLGIRWLVDRGVPEAAARELLALADRAPYTALDLYQEGIADCIGPWAGMVAGLSAGEVTPLEAASGIDKDHCGRFLFWLERYLGDRIAASFGKSGIVPENPINC